MPTGRKQTPMGHIGVMEATKKPANMVPRTIELILLNSASRKPGDRTFPAKNASKIQGRQEVQSRDLVTHYW